MDKRPKIKLELTPSDEAVELLGWLILFAAPILMYFFEVKKAK